MPVNEIMTNAQKKMHDTVEHTRKELATIRTGRASLSILDNVVVDYYGTPTPLQQVATLTVPDPTLIVAQPWDVSLIPKIEKGILSAGPLSKNHICRIGIERFKKFFNEFRRLLQICRHHRNIFSLRIFHTGTDGGKRSQVLTVCDDLCGERQGG